jgi:protein-S-isoprenylcysteine O-methyltransferase Ste14
MHPPNHRPTEMYLGTSDDRRDLLRQQAVGRRQARPGRASVATLAAVVFLVLVLAAVVVGPGRAIDWLVNYLIPVGVITGVIIASFALLLYAFKRLPESPLRDWWQ